VPDYDLAFDHAGRACDRIGLVLIDSVDLPDNLAGLGVQRCQPPIEYADVNLPPVHRDSAIDDVAARLLSVIPGNLRIPLPKQLSAPCIDGVNDAPAPGRINDAVHYNGCGFESPSRFGIERPGQPEILHVRRGNLFQRAESRFTVVTAVSQPITDSTVSIFECAVVDVSCC